MPGSFQTDKLDLQSSKLEQSTVLNKVDQLLQSFQNEFQNEHRQILVKDLDRTRNKLQSLIGGGRDKIQIVTDFDHTISKYHYDNHRAPTCHGVFELDPEVTSETKSMLKTLRDKYYPIEVDPKLNNEAKIPYMVEWWKKAHETIIKCGITRSGLDKTVRQCGLVSRENVDQFFKVSHSYNVPVLIFSAGLGDVIQLFVNHTGLSYDNVRIVSNFMIFNDQDQLVDFTQPIIHSFNKNATSLTSDDRLSKQPNILLIGDSPGDVHMADGIVDETSDADSGSVLRIGFLNDAIEANMERFQTLFDIVLINDDTFDIPLKILQSVLQI